MKARDFQPAVPREPSAFQLLGLLDGSASSETRAAWYRTQAAHKRLEAKCRAELRQAVKVCECGESFTSTRIHQIRCQSCIDARKGQPKPDTNAKPVQSREVGR